MVFLELGNVVEGFFTFLQSIIYVLYTLILFAIIVFMQYLMIRFFVILGTFGFETFTKVKSWFSLNEERFISYFE